MKDHLYTYEATVVRVLDGDTVEATIDRGFKDYAVRHIRLSGINAPELTAKLDSEKKRAAESKAFLSSILQHGTKVIIKSVKLDKYGRSLAVIFVEEDGMPDCYTNVNDLMLSKGHAVPYKG